MQTVKLYDADSHRYAFTARVLSCESEGEHNAVVLDATAFFPEEGGQYGDTGTLDGVRVLDTQMENGIIRHLCEAPLTVGEEVAGQLDEDARFRKMQNHTGEHILSGLIDREYHLRNVGFHLGHGDVTCDYDGVLTEVQLRALETEVNRVIVRNVPVTACYPSPEELAALSYRSKLALTENVRIVTVAGVDVCACCAPHVAVTGEIGLFKITGFQHYKGGIRVHILSGFDALDDYNRKEASLRTIAQSLSVKEENAADGVAKQLANAVATRAALGEARRRLLTQTVETLAPTEKNFVFFEEGLDAGEMRFLLNAALPKCGGICAVFSGNDAEGYQYVIGSRAVPLRACAKSFHSALNGRGGGSDAMIQGSLQAPREAIEKTVTAVFG